MSHEHNELLFKKTCNDLKLRIDDSQPNRLRTFIADKVIDFYTQSGKVNIPGQPTFFRPEEGIDQYLRKEYVPFQTKVSEIRSRIVSSIKKNDLPPMTPNEAFTAKDDTPPTIKTISNDTSDETTQTSRTDTGTSF